MPNLPSGTVTFLFSDIEGSTELLKRLGDDGYSRLLAEHRRVLRQTFTSRHGEEIDVQGDAMFFSFPRARDGVAAAVEAQRAATTTESLGAVAVAVRIRIGLHTGEPAVGDEGYTGLDVVRAARIAAVGRGGQILLSETTRALLGDAVPEGVSVRPIGEQLLKGIDRPEPLHELVIDGLPAPTPETPSHRRPSESEDTHAFAERMKHVIRRRVFEGIERSLNEPNR